MNLVLSFLRAVALYSLIGATQPHVGSLFDISMADCIIDRPYGRKIAVWNPYVLLLDEDNAILNWRIYPAIGLCEFVHFGKCENSSVQCSRVLELFH
ncbi:MAG: hypothetical protein QXT45_03405 [Candidatus Bilamarchaeaceae archaeon]